MLCDIIGKPWNVDVALFGAQSCTWGVVVVEYKVDICFSEKRVLSIFLLFLPPGMKCLDEDSVFQEKYALVPTEFIESVVGRESIR